MATRRKPRNNTYRDGGRVSPDDVTTPDSGGVAPSPPESATPPVAASADVTPPQPAASFIPDDDSPVKRELQRIQRAEELQREMAQRQAPPPDMESQMAAVGLPDPAKAWFRVHPEYWKDREKNREISSLHGYLTTNKRLAPFSDEYFDRLETELGFRAPRAEQMGDVAAPPAPREMPPEPRRSLPISAPVSRNIPMASGGAFSANNTLSPEERDIARRSYSAPDMTDAQKEHAYWVQREKLRRLRATGQYRPTTDATG
jgi:hypothetical protein